MYNKLQINKNGYYSIKFRISKKLKTYFNKELISKSLSTKDINIAKYKSSIIINKYRDILEVTSMDVLEPKQIQEIVNAFVKESLEQDLQARVRCGQGTTFCDTNSSDEYGRLPSLANADICEHLKSDYLEDLSNGNYKCIENTVNELLTKNSFAIDKTSDNYNMLSYYLMLAQIQILDEASKRGRGNVPNHPSSIIKRIFNEGIYEAPTVTDEVRSTKTSKEYTVEEAFNRFDTWYKKQDLAEKTYNLTKNRLMNVLLPLLGKDKMIKDVTIEDIEDLKEFLTFYPNTSLKKYKHLTFEQIRECCEDIPQEDRIGASTQLKYFKILKQVYSWLDDMKMIDLNPTLRVGVPAVDGISWQHFTDSDLEQLFKEFESLDDRKYIYYTLAYTGMRPSEFWKSKIESEDGIFYFDLTSDSNILKTDSSKRKIPLHDKLVDLGIQDKLCELQKRFKQPAISNYFNGTLLDKVDVEDRDRKIMYSFRHTVATKLKMAEVNSDKISEILGHSYENSNTTKEVYASGYNMKILKEAIGKL